MLILIGFVLLILEFLVFPGVNVAGILGFACVGIAIYIAYSTMGTTVGHFTLLGTALCGFGVTYYVLRSKTWKRMQLHTQIDSTVEGVDESIREGDVGMTQGRLAPMGNCLLYTSKSFFLDRLNSPAGQIVCDAEYGIWSLFPGE